MILIENKISGIEDISEFYDWYQKEILDVDCNTFHPHMGAITNIPGARKASIESWPISTHQPSIWEQIAVLKLSHCQETIKTKAALKEWSKN